ncbi:hypothetical protein K3495_g6820 [Podosphaera aphanis]|nr:hypothetical protein K3495_g6820 [Podosphaera aphanis]
MSSLINLDLEAMEEPKESVTSVNKIKKENENYQKIYESLSQTNSTLQDELKEAMKENNLLEQNKKKQEEEIISLRGYLEEEEKKHEILEDELLKSKKILYEKMNELKEEKKFTTTLQKRVEENELELMKLKTLETTNISLRHENDKLIKSQRENEEKICNQLKTIEELVISIPQEPTEKTILEDEISILRNNNKLLLNQLSSREAQRKKKGLSEIRISNKDSRDLDDHSETESSTLSELDSQNLSSLSKTNNLGYGLRYESDSTEYSDSREKESEDDQIVPNFEEERPGLSARLGFPEIENIALKEMLEHKERIVDELQQKIRSLQERCEIGRNEKLTEPAHENSSERNEEKTLESNPELPLSDNSGLHPESVESPSFSDTDTKVAIDSDRHDLKLDSRAIQGLSFTPPVSITNAWISSFLESSASRRTLYSFFSGLQSWKFVILLLIIFLVEIIIIFAILIERVLYFAAKDNVSWPHYILPVQRASQVDFLIAQGVEFMGYQMKHFPMPC